MYVFVVLLDNRAREALEIVWVANFMEDRFYSVMKLYTQLTIHACNISSIHLIGNILLVSTKLSFVIVFVFSFTITARIQKIKPSTITTTE